MAYLPTYVQVKHDKRQETKLIRMRDGNGWRAKKIIKERERGRERQTDRQTENTKKGQSTRKEL